MELSPVTFMLSYIWQQHCRIVTSCFPTFYMIYKKIFIDAVHKGKQYDYSNLAVQFCSKLFEYERRSQNKKHTFAQRKAYRLEKEKPILDVFWN